MVNVSFNNTPRVVEVSMDTSKDITEESLTTDSIIAPSGTLTLTGGLTTTAPVTIAEGLTLVSNDTDNTSTIWMHGSNATHPDCSIVCSNGTSGLDNTGSLSVYAGDFKINGSSVITNLAAASNARSIFFNVCSNYNGTVFYGDGVHDDQPAIMAEIVAAEAASLVTENCVAHVYIPAGFKVYLGSSVTISKPLKFECNSMCYYYGSTSSAFIIGTDTTTSASSNCQYHDFTLMGVRACINQWTAPPSLIDTTASCGVEIRQAQFSTFKIGYVIAFKKYGIWLNCSNSLSSTFQHVQDCTFNIAECGYCGVGLMIQSHDAELGAAQVNSFNIDHQYGYELHTHLLWNTR